jgi:hypothetical protein
MNQTQLTPLRVLADRGSRTWVVVVVAGVIQVVDFPLLSN